MTIVLSVMMETIRMKRFLGRFDGALLVGEQAVLDFVLLCRAT